jgi:hypothetical protein
VNQPTIEPTRGESRLNWVIKAPNGDTIAAISTDLLTIETYGTQGEFHAALDRLTPGDHRDDAVRRLAVPKGQLPPVLGWTPAGMFDHLEANPQPHDRDHPDFTVPAKPTDAEMDLPRDMLEPTHLRLYRNHTPGTLCGAIEVDEEPVKVTAVAADVTCPDCRTKLEGNGAQRMYSQPDGYRPSTVTAPKYAPEKTEYMIAVDHGATTDTIAVFHTEGDTIVIDKIETIRR